ncbi:Transcriptional activator protein LasR [Pandoraea morbifera]|uniref:Transcriptional activator protein LasR n=1 Tax=Pandoraea morbifera TaxID=2508300 RepID=A0A5E4T1K4_9BURK|nr:autoinducer binding domain-containing protein [Pandoraea morbifera]VVD81331.1 Transcriptional activator protein LasR [Pandoraea morbifera]
MRATRCPTPRSFTDHLSTLHAASDVDGVRAALVPLCRALRQRYFCYRGHFPLPGDGVAVPRLGNLPRAWEARYEQRRYGVIDPVLALAARQLTPVEWTPALYASPEARELLREQRAAGLRAGITYPVFAPSGASGTLSLSSSHASARRLRANGTHAWVLHAGAVLAMHVHEAVWRIVQRDASGAHAPVLTPRERECLQWVARGKTSWEIGRILTISEHGVVFHLRSVMRKFNVSSRHRAAKLASDYGLLDDGPAIASSQAQVSTPSCSPTVASLEPASLPTQAPPPPLSLVTFGWPDPRASCTASR